MKMQKYICNRNTDITKQKYGGNEFSKEKGNNNIRSIYYDV